ncbi:MAG: hypothetical protein ACFFA4_04165 [Promethearchaeota archaeon]
MYPDNINCLEIETNDSYSKVVTRILLITIIVTVGLSILGAWDVAQNDIQQDDFELSFIPENKFSGEYSSEINISDDFSQEKKLFSIATFCGSSDVSVPEKGCFGPFDTLPGDMEIAAQVLPDEPLPLCIDNDYLDDYYIIVGTYGGYAWVDGWINVMQTKSDECIVGVIDIRSDPIEYADGTHGWSYYMLTFYIEGHPIILDSNHIPDSPLGDFFVCGPDNLDKWVFLKVCTIWEGCEKPEQEFMVILAHKALSQNKIPNSR